ncbi:MAG: tyrosine-type recombinase/integrase [Anaerorhabdus sp.]|uniref:tyrosine-type recombinase/integrase n=1 Tax=Anaerorhabdus sp. TaxID=1872524 RepID=UPI003A879A10
MKKENRFKEKYIKSRQDRKGKWSFQIRLDYLNNSDEICSYYKTFYEIDYSSASDAFKTAIKHRNEMDIKLRGSSTKQIYSKGKKASSSNAMTIEKIYKEYPKYFSYAKPTRKKHDIVYKQSIEVFADKKIYDITPADIVGTMSSKTNEYSQDKLDRILSVWRIIFKTAIYLGSIKYDPTVCVEVPRSKKVRNPRGKDTSLDIIKRITAALLESGNTDKTRFNYKIIYYAIWFQYYTGLRPSEVYSIRKSRIDLNKNILYIRSRVGSTKDETNVEVDVKTDNGIRSQPIIPKFKKLILEILEFQNKETDYLFADYEGNLISSSYQSDAVARIAKRIGVEFNTYRVRSLFSKEILKTPASAKTVIELMGHGSIGQSIDYDFTNTEEMREALMKRKYN